MEYCDQVGVVYSLLLEDLLKERGYGVIDASSSEQTPWWSYNLVGVVDFIESNSGLVQLG